MRSASTALPSTPLLGSCRARRIGSQGPSSYDGAEPRRSRAAATASMTARRAAPHRRARAGRAPRRCWRGSRPRRWSCAVASTPASSRARSIRSVRASTRAPASTRGSVLWALVTIASAPCGERVRRQRRVEPEVRAPRGVDDERDAVRVRDRRPRPADVADGAHVRRVADEDRGASRRARRGRPRGRRRSRRSGGRGWRRPPAVPTPVAARRAPARAASTAVQRPGDDHPSPGRATASARAWLPCVEPPTLKRQRSAPHSRAARRSASATTPRDTFMVSSPAYSGTSPATTCPTRSARCLCPGIVNGVGRLSRKRS